MNVKNQYSPGYDLYSGRNGLGADPEYTFGTAPRTYDPEYDYGGRPTAAQREADLLALEKARLKRISDAQFTIPKHAAASVPTGLYQPKESHETSKNAGSALPSNKNTLQNSTLSIGPNFGQQPQWPVNLPQNAKLPLTNTGQNSTFYGRQPLKSVVPFLGVQTNRNGNTFIKTSANTAAAGTSAANTATIPLKTTQPRNNAYGLDPHQAQFVYKTGDPVWQPPSTNSLDPEYYYGNSAMRYPGYTSKQNKTFWEQEMQQHLLNEQKQSNLQLLLHSIPKLGDLSNGWKKPEEPLEQAVITASETPLSPLETGENKQNDYVISHNGQVMTEDISVVTDNMTTAQLREVMTHWKAERSAYLSLGSMSQKIRYDAAIKQLSQVIEEREIFGLEPNLTPDMAAKSVDSNMLLNLMVPDVDPIGLILSVDRNLGNPLVALQNLRNQKAFLDSLKAEGANTQTEEFRFEQNKADFLRQVEAECRYLATIDRSRLTVQQVEALNQYNDFLNAQFKINAFAAGTLNTLLFGFPEFVMLSRSAELAGMSLMEYAQTPQAMAELHPTAYGIGSFAGQMLSYASINSLIANSPALQGMSNKLVGWLVKHGFAEVTAERTGRLVLGRLTDLPADLVNAARQADDVGEFLLNLSASTAQGLVADLALEGVTELWHRVRGDIAEFETQTTKNNPVSQQDLDFAQGSEKTVIIGESMKRVIPYAEKIGAEVYEGFKYYDKTKAIFGEKLANFIGGVDNALWLIDKMVHKYKIVDLGLDVERAIHSPYYLMESVLSYLYKYKEYAEDFMKGVF